MSPWVIGAVAVFVTILSLILRNAIAADKQRPKERRRNDDQ